ncbi:HNH endonuclease family protein [Moraxella bovis]|nr:HNH endonuclease family protein [Moraxella bovis]UYZ82056.1 HNH endonuclease family protein [Moraxella bovis]UZA10691.1 HNH endonuclease family protein [Moraxella bovis]
MNNRGEQLEQHEVIKAKLMSKLDIDDRAVFSAIWNACSDMSRYAVSSFEPKLRDALFFPNDKIDESGKKIDEGEYFAFYQLDEFDKLRDKYKTVYSKKTDDKSQENQESIESSGTVSTENMPTLENILQKKKIIFNSDDNQKGDGERFTSIIDFPNFLAQVLYLFLKDKHCINADIHRLDAGNLNKQFDEAGLYGNEDRIKKFGVHLLNIRLLFDRYVIKHDGHESKDDWCIYTYQWLKKDKKNDFRNTFDKENSKIIMLQTMFHYSFPARNYKYWLFAYLKWLNDESRKKLEKHEADGCAFKLPANEHIKFLEQLCDKFYFNRFYQNDFSKEYFDIIYNQEVLVLNLSHDDKRCAFLNTGTAVENFIFNRLDYILWRKQGRWCWRNDENFKTGVDLSKFLKEFKFTSRNSVEHYYPQNPINGEKLSDNDDENGKILNNFGNLCLINHSQNSSLSNRMPDEKKSGYKDNVARHQSVSIKQLLMFTYKVWDKNTIQEHGEKMIQLLNEKIST